jgi:hypothetical protein
VDSIRPIDPRDRNPDQFLRVERLREERDAPQRERHEPRDEPEEEKPKEQPAPAGDAETAPGDNRDEPGDGSLIDVRV